MSKTDPQHPWFKDVENPPFADVALHDDEGITDKEKKSGASDIGSHLAYHLAGQVYESAKTQAGGFFNIYGNLDLIRPYFDVDVKVVLKRLLLSLVPNFSATGAKGDADLYGPTMLAFTLVALVLMVLKLSDVVLAEGTLMGASFAVCFSYWLVFSVLLRFSAYLLSADLDIVETSSAVGYGLFGYCLTLSAYYLLPPFSAIACYLFGGLSAVTLGSFFYSRFLPRNKTQAILVGVSVGLIHYLYLFYLRFFFVSWL